MFTRNKQRHGGSSIKSAASVNHKYSPENCRVCLDDGEIPIFGNNDISKDVNEFGNIVVSEDDNLPQYLCEACYTLLEAAILFRKTAKQADEVLKRPHYLENGSEDSDHLSESELSIKREYLEFDYNSDSELYYDLNKIKQNYGSDDESVINATISETEYLDTNDNDYQIKQEEVTNSDVDKEMFMIIISDKENQMQMGCEKCNITFKTVEELASHNIKSHPEVPPNQRECGICHKFINISSYKIHLKKHREDYKRKHDKKYGKVECEICGKKISKAYLKHHTKMHGTAEEQAQRSTKCPVCNKTFTSHYFPDHMRRVHDKVSKQTKNDKNNKETNKTIYKKCPVCDRRVKEDEFKLHLTKHGGTHRRFVCDQCGKVFIHQSAFKTHCLTHGSELKYKCQFCPYRGLHQALLKVHVRTHTGDYNYKCSECPARFITKSNLSKHLLRHNGANACKFKCEKCHKAFNTRRRLDKHTQTVHSTVRNNICNICGKAFGHRDNMLSHQLKVHKRERLITKGRMPSYLKAQQMSD